MMNVHVEKICSHESVLGEGLYCDQGFIAWIDIERDELLILEKSFLRCHKLFAKPSVIFSRLENTLLIGTDQGMLYFDLLSSSAYVDRWRGFPHKESEFRANDGAINGGFGLIGFMHRTSPEENKGSICRLEGNQLILLDDDIYIPNGFVFLDDRRVLICDSVKSTVYLYVFDAGGKMQSRSVFHEFEPHLAPDGGCIIDNQIWFALWDGGALVCLDFSGNELKRIDVPCKRPTNCKYDALRDLVVYTSASLGLEKDGKQGITYGLRNLQSNPHAGC